jgi:FkbM family methyltransferase
MAVNLDIVLDIGSYHGQFGDMIHEVWPLAQVISIEANPDHKQINPQQITACLSDQDDLWVEYYTLPPGNIVTGASYYRENTHFYQNPIVTPVRTVKLDTLYQQLGWQGNWCGGGLIKIDTQGSELDILQGAQVFLTQQQPRLLLLEVSHQPYNLGAPTASHIVSYLYQTGYKWIDTWGQFRDRDHTLLQSDLLFERMQ